MGGEIVARDMRPVARLDLEIGVAEQLDEILVALFVLHQQRQMRGLFLAAGSRRGRAQLHRQQRAENGLHRGQRDFRAAFAFLDLLGELFGNLIDAEHIVDVGDRHRRHGVFPRQLGQLIGADSAFQQGIGTLHPQVNEGRHFVNLTFRHGRQYRRGPAARGALQRRYPQRSGPQLEDRKHRMGAAGQHEGRNHENDKPSACRCILDPHHRDLPLCWILF